jgi:hypothetical protein
LFFGSFKSSSRVKDGSLKTEALDKLNELAVTELK